MDSELPPKYPDPIPEAKATLRSTIKGRGWLFGLIFYAGAITAGLIVVSVLGSMYIKDVKSTCSHAGKGDGSSPDHYKNYTRKQPDDKRADTSLDTEANKEIVRIRDGDEKETILVFDFTKSIIGIWNPESDECYLIGGIDENIPDARKTESILEDLGLSDKPSMDNGDDPVEYTVARDYPVKDLHLLPKELHSHCWGKNVYWVEKEGTSTDDDGGVQKRSTRCCPRTCYYRLLYCDSAYCYYRFLCLCYRCA